MRGEDLVWFIIVVDDAALEDFVVGEYGHIFETNK